VPKKGMSERKHKFYSLAEVLEWGGESYPLKIYKYIQGVS
jgi:hypothetical protein